MQSGVTVASRYLRIGGILAIIAATQWIIGVFIAQAYYPNYSITQNDLSDLGATCHNAVMPIAAVTIYRVRLEAPPYFRYLSMLFGVISLAGLAIMLSVSFATLEGSVIGHGGDERIIVYPLLAWEIVLGVSLIRSLPRTLQR